MSLSTRAVLRATPARHRDPRASPAGTRACSRASRVATAVAAADGGVAESTDGAYKAAATAALNNCVTSSDLKYGQKYEGKVRDTYVDDDLMIAVTTDRQSAFDRHLASIPFKGAVLNRTSVVVQPDEGHRPERVDLLARSQRHRHEEVRGFSHRVCRSRLPHRQHQHAAVDALQQGRPQLLR